MQSDLEYFRGRAQEEIDASLAAVSTVARKAHLELAHRYSELADAIEQSSLQIAVSRPTEPASSIG